MADIDAAPAPTVDIAPPEPTAPAVPDFVEFTGVESGYELAPVEPLPLDVAPAPEPEIIDGDWRVIEEPAPLELSPAPQWQTDCGPEIPPEWQTTPRQSDLPDYFPPVPAWPPEPAPVEANPQPQSNPQPEIGPDWFPAGVPQWQPEPRPVRSLPPVPASRPATRSRPGWLTNPLPRTGGMMTASPFGRMAPQRAIGGFSLWSPFRLDGWLTGFPSWFSLDWLAGPPARYSRQRAAVDYLAYQVESEHGGTVHYFLNNIKRIRPATETYTDEGLYLFTIPIYLKGPMERAAAELERAGVYIERIE